MGEQKAGVVDLKHALFRPMVIAEVDIHRARLQLHRGGVAAPRAEQNGSK